jgi:hypothetical protein
MAGKPAAPLKPHKKEKHNCLWNEIWKKKKIPLVVAKECACVLASQYFFFAI